MNITVPSGTGVTVAATFPLTHRCPYRAETDHGHIDITWTTAGATLELHALAAWLDGFAREQITHEDISSDIRGHLADLPGIDNPQVATRWKTAGADVVVTCAVPGQRLRREGA